MILREIAVRLGLEVDEASFAKGALVGNLAAAAVEKLVEWGKEAVEGFVEMVKGVAETGRELDKTAQMTGLTTKALQELRFAADESGTGAESLSTGIFHLARSMAAAKKGSEEQSTAFRKLGVKVTDSHGKLKDADEVLMDMSDHFSKMPDGIEKTALAIQVFGRSGAQMIPMLNKGREGLAELRGEAFVMSPEQIAAGKELTITLERIALVTKNLWKAAIAPLLPALTDLAKRFLAWKKASAEVLKQYITKYVGYLIKALHMLGSVVEGVIEVLGTLISIFKTIVVGAGHMLLDFFREIGPVARTAALAFAAAWIIAGAPLLALAGVVGYLLLILNSFRRYREGKDSLVGEWLKALDDWMKPRDTDTWFVAAIKDFLHYLHEAIKSYQDFRDMIEGKSHPAVSSNKGEYAAKSYAQTSTAARTTLEAGGQLTEEQRRAFLQHGVNPESVVQKYSPTLGPVSQPGLKPLYIAPVQFNITQQPGQSAEELANIIDQRFQQHQDDTHEAAAAALE